MESKENSRLKSEVKSLSERLVTAAQRFDVERIRSDKLEEQLRDTQMTLETSRFSDRSLAEFDNELVCSDYAAEVSETYFLDSADDYCSEK